MWAGIYIMHTQARYCTAHDNIGKACIGELFKYATETQWYQKYGNNTALQLVLARACNLSCTTERIIDPKFAPKKVPKCALKLCQKVVILVRLSTQVKRVSVSCMWNFWMASLRYFVKFWQTFAISTAGNQFEGLIFRSNLTKILLATQDYFILYLRYFLEVLGRFKCTFS